MTHCITSSENPIFLQNVLIRQWGAVGKATTEDLKLWKRANFYSWKSSESFRNADNHLRK